MESILLTDESRIISENSCYQEIKSIREKNGGHSATFNLLMKNILDDDERINKKYGTKNLFSNRQEKINQSADFSIKKNECILKVERGQNTEETSFLHSKQNNYSPLYLNPKQDRICQIDYSAVLKEPLVRSTHYSSLPLHTLTPLAQKLVQKTQYVHPQIIIPSKQILIQQRYYHVPIQRVSNIISNREFPHISHCRNKSEIAISQLNWLTISAEAKNQEVMKFENKNESLLFGTKDSFIQKSSNLVSRPKEDLMYYKIQKQIQENIKNQKSTLSNIQNYQQFLSKKQQSIDSGLYKLNEQKKKTSDHFTHSRHVSNSFTKTKFDLTDSKNSNKIKLQMGNGQTIPNQNESLSIVHKKRKSFDSMYRFLVPRSNLFQKSLERIPENSEQSSMIQMNSQAQVKETQNCGYQKDNKFKKPIKESIFAQQSAESMNIKSSRIRSEANLDESITKGLETLLELSLDNLAVSEGEQFQQN